MKWLRFSILAAFAAFLSCPLFAQGSLFGGMSGAALPGADSSSTFGWRPFVGVTANYFHNLTTLDTGPVKRDLYGFGILGGISGSKSWGRTSFGLSYRGLGRFTYRNEFSGIQNHVIATGLTHRFTPRLSLFSSLLAGMTDGGMGFGSLIGGLGGLAPIYGFSANPGYGGSALDDTLGNPNNNNLVDDEVLDTRTYFGSASAGLNYRLTERSYLSGGAAGIITRRSDGQFGIQGYSLRSNYNYSLTPRSSVGLFYGFGSYNYHRAFGNLFSNSTALSYQHILTPTVTLSVSAGIFNIHSDFVGVVPLDPVIAELLGKPTGLAIQQTSRWSYSGLFNLQKTFGLSGVNLFARRQFFPGNGFVMGAERTVAGISYFRRTTDKLTLSTGVTYSHYRGVLQRDLAFSNYGVNFLTNYRVSNEWFLRLGVVFRAMERTGSTTTYQAAATTGAFWSPGTLPLAF